MALKTIGSIQNADYGFLLRHFAGENFSKDAILAVKGGGCMQALDKGGVLERMKEGRKKAAEAGLNALTEVIEAWPPGQERTQLLTFLDQKKSAGEGVNARAFAEELNKLARPASTVVKSRDDAFGDFDRVGVSLWSAAQTLSKSNNDKVARDAFVGVARNEINTLISDLEARIDMIAGKQKSAPETVSQHEVALAKIFVAQVEELRNALSTSLATTIQEAGAISFTAVWEAVRKGRQTLATPEGFPAQTVPVQKLAAFEVLSCATDYQRTLQTNLLNLLSPYRSGDVKTPITAAEAAVLKTGLEALQAVSKKPRAPKEEAGSLGHVVKSMLVRLSSKNGNPPRHEHLNRWFDRIATMPGYPGDQAPEPEDVTSVTEASTKQRNRLFGLCKEAYALSKKNVPAGSVGAGGATVPIDDVTIERLTRELRQVKKTEMPPQLLTVISEFEEKLKAANSASTVSAVGQLAGADIQDFYMKLRDLEGFERGMDSRSYKSEIRALFNSHIAKLKQCELKHRHEQNWNSQNNRGPLMEAEVSAHLLALRQEMADAARDNPVKFPTIDKDIDAFITGLEDRFSWNAVNSGKTTFGANPIRETIDALKDW